MRNIDITPDTYEASSVDQTGTILYVSSTTHNGDFDTNNDGDARPELDAFCSTYKPSNLQCNNIHAFISVNGNDEIKDMPANYGYNPYRPVYWYGGSKLLTKMATTWTDFLDSSILTTQVFGTGNGSNVFTGTYFTGFLTEHCNYWTDTTGTGRYGNSNDSSGGWLYGSSTNCSDSLSIRCACTP